MRHIEINQKDLKNYKLGNLPPYQYMPNPVANHTQDWTITRVSIIIPAFNAFDTISQTLMSIAMQENIHEIETIIVDDCSTEGTYDEIAEIFSKFMKIKVIRLEKGLGPGGARQVGFDHAVGLCLTAIDADDCFCRPDAISMLERCMFEKDQDCVIGQFLEQNEDGMLHPHNAEMVWVFCHAYSKAFLDKYGIRMNVSHSNEDTGFNRLIAGLTNRIWFLGDYSGLYMWRHKNTSITRFNNGMYGGGSGETGYLGNMMWQIDHLKRRYVNSNYILREILMVMFNCYWFFSQNQYQWPLQSDKELNRMRFYYWNYYEPIKDKIEPEVFKQLYIESANGRNIEQQGCIPKMTIYQFLDKLAEKQYEINADDDVDGSEPIHLMYEDTPDDVPVTVSDYTNNICEFFSNRNNNTNLARMDTMDRLIAEEQSHKFKDLRTVKNDPTYDKDGKKINNKEKIEDKDIKNIKEENFGGYTVWMENYDWSVKATVYERKPKFHPDMKVYNETRYGCTIEPINSTTTLTEIKNDPDIVSFTDLPEPSYRHLVYENTNEGLKITVYNGVKPHFNDNVDIVNESDYVTTISRKASKKVLKDYDAKYNLKDDTKTE